MHRQQLRRRRRRRRCAHRHHHHHHPHQHDEDDHQIIESPVSSATLQQTIETGNGLDNIVSFNNDDDDDHHYMMSPITFPSFDDSNPFDTGLVSSASGIQNDEDMFSFTLTTVGGDGTTTTATSTTRPPTTATTTTTTAINNKKECTYYNG